MKSRNGVAVPAATSGTRLQTVCMTVHAGEMWDPQQELLQPTPHFSPSKNSHSKLLAWMLAQEKPPCSSQL